MQKTSNDYYFEKAVNWPSEIPQPTKLSNCIMANASIDNNVIDGAFFVITCTVVIVNTSYIDMPSLTVKSIVRVDYDAGKLQLDLLEDILNDIKGKV